MKRYLFSLFAILCVAGSTFAGKVYINPGHGSWHQNSRNMLTISVPRYNDTLGFYESNTNLWKCLILEEKLKKDGHSVKMSRRSNGGTWQQSSSTIDKKLSVIAMEAESWKADYFISVHSNAASSVTVNYPAYFYRGKDGKAYVTNSDKMCKKAWPHTFIIHDNGMEPHSYWSMSNPGIYADITAMGSSSTVNNYTGYFGVLKHGRPGFLIEGYFHTYGPARHRALNPDWCRQEGIRHYRGVRQWYRDNGSGSSFGQESKGYFMGYIRTKEKTMDSYSNYYTYSTSTKNAKYNKDDKYMPLNGAKVQLKDANGNIIKTNCYHHVKRMLKNQDYYTTDNNWNGVFVYEDLAPGTYTYTVYANGYKDYTGTVTIKADETSYAKVWMTSGTGSTPSEPSDPSTPSTISVTSVWEKSNVKTPVLDKMPTVVTASRGGFVVKNGKIYLQDKANKKLLVYNASTGAYENEITGTPDAYHLNLDSKGNLIYNVWRNGFTGFHFQAFDLASGTQGKDFGKDSTTLTTRADFAAVYGDMLAGTGYGYAVGNSDTKLVRNTYTNGSLTKAETFTLSASAGGSNYVTVVDANNCIVNLRSTKIVWYDMSTKTETELGLAGAEACASVGGAYFELNKKKYLVQAYKTTNNYQGNFKIYDITNKTASEIFHRNSDLGTVSNSGTTVVMFRAVVSGNKAYIYEYVPGNGMACYVLTDSSMTDTPTPEDPVTPPAQGSITWNLNGGQTNPYGWASKEDMWKQFMADYRAYYGVTTAECPDTDIKNAAGFTWKTKKMRDFLKDDKSAWKWLGTYITDVVEGQGGAVEPEDSIAWATPGDNIEPYWRYHVHAFFGDTLRADVDANNDGNIDLTDTKEHFWPQSGDFTKVGVSNVINWYQYSGYYIGSYPTVVTDTFELPIPHKSGEHFGGWYTNSSCTGTAISSVAPGETITLYALWGEPTTPDVVWVLNGGKVGGAAPVPTQEELWAKFKTATGLTLGTLAEIKSAAGTNPHSDPNKPCACRAICANSQLNEATFQTVYANAEWKWLMDYIKGVQTGIEEDLTVDGATAAWRYAIAAFFLQTQHDAYPKSADFSTAGKPEAWGPAYQAANGTAAIELPSFIKSAYTIPTPTKDNDTFIGWYDNNNGTGVALTVLPAGYKGTVYAIWKSMNVGTSVENVRPQLDVNAPMYDIMGRQVDETYRGIIIQNGNKYLLR